MKTGRYKIGDEVIIMKPGVHLREVGTILDVTEIAAKLTMAGKPWFVYTVEAVDWSVRSGGNFKLELTLEEGDLAPYKLVKGDNEVVCVCGGDFLTIPHHYDWCPKGANNGKNNKNAIGEGQVDRQAYRR